MAAVNAMDARMMRGKLQELTNDKDDSKLRDFVQNTDVEELCKLLRDQICSADIVKTLDSVLNVCNDTEALQIKRRKLVEAILTALSKAKVNANHADEIINRVIIDFPSYSKQQLIKLVNFCLAGIRNNEDEYRSWKDILPILLEVLEDEKYINHNNSEVSGMEYKSLIVQSICNSHWDPGILAPLTKMFGEISLEKGDHDIVLRTLCSKLPVISLNEVPPFVHQALKFCSNRDNAYLLEALRKYFTSCYQEVNSTDDEDSIENIGVLNLKEVQDVESTVLYHIYQAAQLNHKNVKDFIRSLKNVSTAPEYVLEPFMLSVLLLISIVYEDEIFEVLRVIINRKIQDNEKRKNSAWLREMIPDTDDVMIVVQQVIENSCKDRHLVLKGLVNLGFVLMDTERSKTDINVLWDMGSKILQELMKKRHEIGVTVLQKLVEKIVGGGLLILQYTDCLSYMCRKLTMIILDSQAWIITLLEQLASIPSQVAAQILYAIFPLVRISANIRDTLILLLRKILYRKGTLRRQMAVLGFLELLTNLKPTTSTPFGSSQANSSTSTLSLSSLSVFTQVNLERNSQQSWPLYAHDKTLSYEILSILRKCFSHEFEVRLCFYKGLYDVTSRNSEMREYIIDILFSHLNSYYEEDENVMPALRFELCTDIHGVEAVLQEPLAELIFVLQKMYIKVSTKSSTIIEKLGETLESLCRRMAETELQHLNLDDNSELLENTSKAQQKLQNVKSLIMTYEALMCYKIGMWSAETTDNAQNVYNLFKSYKKFVDFVKRLTKSKKGEGRNKKDRDTSNTTITKKSNRSNGIKLPNTTVDLETVRKVLSLLYLKSVPWATKEEATFLKRHQEFHRYILQVCMQLLQNAKSLKDEELRRHKHRYSKLYLEIGKLLYYYPVIELSEMMNGDLEGTVLALECFKELCKLMCNSFSTCLQNFLCGICDPDTPTDMNSLLQELIFSLKSQLKTFLDEEIDREEAYLKKIPYILLETIQELVRKIPFHETKGEKLFEWAKQLTKFENMEPAFVSMILQHLLWTEERTKDYGETLNNVCLELCSKLGTVDKTEVTAEESFKIIREDTAVEIYNILNSHVREKLINVSWLLSRFKGEQAIACIPGMDEELYREKLREKERSCCRQLSYIIQALHILANTSVSAGQSTDAMFKNLQQLYVLLASLTRYFNGKSTCQYPAFQTAKFIQVVKLAGKPLKSAFYNLVTHTEESQNTNKTRRFDSHAQRNKVLKETKIIPRVVYEIEQFNKEILLLAKKTGIPLENYIKHSITRDFRINNPQLVEDLEKLDISALITQETQNSQNPQDTTRTDTPNTSMEADESSPSKKRRKRNANLQQENPH